MKNFYLKIIVFLLIIISAYLSVETYYTYIQNKNFKVLNQRHSLIIQLPNTEYIELVSRNDHVSGNDFLERPFSSNTKIVKNSNLENSIASTNSHTEYVENGDLIRFLTVTPISNEYIRVQVDTETKYMYQEGLFYNIQIDYTNKTDFTQGENRVEFTDKGCKVSIVGEDVKYSFTDNGQSVILSKQYEPKMTFKFNLNIDCSK